MIRNLITINKRLLIAVFLLNLLVITQGQSSDVTLNLQGSEFKIIDLSDYFGVIINSFQITSQQSINGLKTISPVVFNGNKVNPPLTIFSDSSINLPQSATTSFQINAEISSDRTSTTLCTLTLNSITNVQRVLTITKLSTYSITDSQAALMNNVSVQLISQNGISFVLISSIEKTIFYYISIQYPNLSLQEIKSTNFLASRYSNLRFYESKADYGNGYFIGMNAYTVILSSLTSHFQSLSFNSVINSPCGANNKNIQFIENDAFYLIKCNQNNGQQYFSVFQINNDDSSQPILAQVMGEYLETSLPDNITTRTIVKTINNNLVYVLEQSQNSNVNTMILHKITFFPNSQDFGVETSSFGTVVSDTAILGTYFIDDDLIAIVTTDFVLGFSVKKNKLNYRIQLVPKDNLTLISARQIFSTLLFTYSKNTTPESYETDQVVLSMPNLTIDMSQVQTTPFSFSIREKQNQFNQVVNFQINTLSTTQATTSILQNQQNVFQVVSSTTDNIIDSTLEDIVIGSDLQITINDFQSESAKLQSSIFQIQQYSKVQTSFDMSTLVSIQETYLEDIYLFITTNSICMMQSSVNNENALTYNMVAKMDITPTPVTDGNGVSLLPTNQVAIPMQNSSGAYFIGTVSPTYPNGKFAASDPYNNYVFSISGAYLMVTQYKSSSNSISHITSSKTEYTGSNFVSILANPKRNIIYLSDNNDTIFSVSYIPRYDSQQINIIPKQETSRQVILFFESYIVIRLNGDGTSEIDVYNYNDQLSFTTTKSDPLFLRTLIGLSYTLQLTNFQQIYTSKQSVSGQQYIAIPALNSNKQSVYVIFRLHEVTSQNQLYTSVPIDASKAKNIYFGNKQLGYLTFTEANYELISYSFSYFINLQIGYEINSESYRQSYLFKAVSQINIASNNNIQKNDPQSIAVDISLQKNLESENGQINQQSKPIEQLLNYYQSQPLLQNNIYYFNDEGTYSGNILGWQVAFSPLQLQLSIYVQSSLSRSYVNGMNAYDVLQFGELIIFTYKNLLIIPKLISLDLGQNLDFCYLQTDESSVKTTVEPLTKKNIIQMDIYTLCTSTNDPKQQYLNKITIKQTPTQDSNIPKVSVVKNVQWVTSTSQFDKTTQTLIKISTDPEFGLMVGIQYFGQIQYSICQIVTTAQTPLQFNFDCTIDTTMKFLRVVNFMWSPQCQSTIFFTLDGLAYYQVTKDFAKFQVISIKSLLLSQNQNVQINNQVVGVSTLGFSDQTIVIIGFDNLSVFQVALVFNDQKLFNSLSSKQYFVEPNYLFSGYASMSQDKSETILAMYDQQNYDQIVFFYYQSLIEPFTIKSSSIQQFVEPLTLNGEMKIFYIKNICYYFLNVKGDSANTLSQLEYTGKNGIYVNNYNSTVTYNSIGFYLTPIDVKSTQLTTLPVQVNITKTVNASFSSVLQSITIFIFGYLLF